MMNEQRHAVTPSETKVEETSFVGTQPAGESLARVFLGSPVQNGDGETIGDVHDVMFDRDGQITSVLLGVGGFIGLGEKIVAIAFDKLTVTSGKDGTRSLVVSLDKRRLEEAPRFVATEKTTLDSISDLAGDLGQKAMVGAGRIKDQAVTTVDSWRK